MHEAITKFILTNTVHIEVYDMINTGREVGREEGTNHSVMA